MAFQIASVTKLSSLCRTLIPCIHNGQGFFFSGRECGVSGSNSRAEVVRTWRPVLVKATSSQRWTLDDVEKISKGKASKAKTGSRKVPHRLQAGERTAYDLAKKKGYLVQRAVSRKYPLVNTYRNFCDASNRLCIFIQQGPTGADSVVIDLAPLRLGGGALAKLREQVSEVVQSTLQSFGADGDSTAEDDAEDEPSSSSSQSEDDEEEEEVDDEGTGDESLRMLRFETGRAEAKAACQAAWEFWQTHTKSGKSPVAEEGRGSG